MELLSAFKIETPTPKVASGWNPRILHLLPANAEGEVCPVELKIHERFWIERRLLSQLEQAPFSLPNKTVFARWLGLSYTRMELPNSFNNALQRSKIQKFITDRLSPLQERIHGIFFEITNEAFGTGNPASPEQVALLDPPYDLEITVVIYDEEDRKILQGEIDKLFEATMQDPDNTLDEHGKVIKRSRAKIAEKYGVFLLSAAIETVQSWRTADLLRTVRYTEIDYLSGADEDID